MKDFFMFEPFLGPWVIVLPIKNCTFATRMGVIRPFRNKFDFYT